ncbi:formate--tetrahydrofolate ligase [Spiroplasma culicicola]|uniref:Formate--tetrahydrofolate ligase n=1 Tax=Spiroplasma culicicola AES-1 TaxID=1276246 RepID=W6AFP6_9MOLU|nr:formate--tetrahydrofolate ligase [Spiroplasma culicicola]AHI52529.1 formate--tetrahydrofolate ligase [Spiroplasma culicicola AES-1]
MEKIIEQLEKLNIKKEDYEFYGKNIAKINYKNYMNKTRSGKLILMTSINPTPAGEGKTTTAIGLADGLNYIGKKAILALREPSLGPVFGRKGTATGGGESEVTPVDKINLHFTGDIHAISTANNLIAASIDNVIYWKNELNIDPNKIVWKRCMDLNDRSLRQIEIKITKDISRKEEFTITAASNMMTILSLAKDEEDLRLRLENSLIAYDKQGKEIYLKSLNITGAVMALLVEAIKPNFVLTKYNSPTLVHCGPFANIATGTNSIISTQLALRLGDYTIVESGFGSDLGFEKYINVINQQNDLIPDCVVMVVTLRALNLHNDFDLNFDHLEKHLKHVSQYQLNMVVAINYIDGDSEKQLQQLQQWLTQNGYQWEMNEAYIKGASGAQKLAQKVVEVCQNSFEFKPLIEVNDSIKDKITKITKNFYYLDQVNYSKEAQIQIEQISKSQYKDLPLCMVKSHSALDGNEKNLENYIMNIEEVRINSGARFILVFTNNVMSMPGLAKYSNANDIDFIEGKITGLK